MSGSVAILSSSALEMSSHARDRFALENIAIVDELAEQTLGLLSDFNTQIELRDARIEVDLLDLKAVKPCVFDRIVTQPGT